MTISLSGTTGIITPAETVNGNETVTGNSSVTGNLTVTGLINANGGGLIRSGTVISAATTTFSGSIDSGGTVLTAGAPSAGTIQIGQVIAGTNVATGTTILAQLTGTPGGAGTYTVSLPATGAVSGAITIVGVDFLNIPPTTKRITLMLQGFSTSGGSIVVVRLGDSGGIETTEYSGSTEYASTYAAYSAVNGVPLDTASTAALGTVRSGSVVFTLLDSTTNLWSVSGNISLTTASALIITAGTKALSATLDRVRITTVNGTDTLDAGSINILYE